MASLTFVYLIRTVFAGNEQNNVDFTLVNVLFNRISSVCMGFLIVNVASFMPIMSHKDGINILEQLLSRNFLNNYFNYGSLLILTGN